jgi:putative transposase
MCRCLGASRPGYYQWVDRTPGPREKRSAAILVEIHKIMRETKQAYGVRRVHEELSDRGIPCSRGLVEALMKKHGIRAKRVRPYKKTTDSNHNELASPNKLARNFAPARPNEVWTSDITYLRTRNGWLYLCVWIDLFSRKVVGWSISTHMRASFVCAALQDALARRPGARPLVHSDRGSQYASKEFRTLLWRNKLKQSMSRKGNCWDNAPTESFFSTLKQELDVYELRTASVLRQEVFEYIEIFYNRRRLHSTIGYKTPEEVEKQYWSIDSAS